MNEKTYPVSVRGDFTVIAGLVKVTGLSEFDLANSVLAPVLKIDAKDGYVEVLGYSLVKGSDYRPVDVMAAVEEAKSAD